jgi:hypothetical protein
VDPWLTKEDNSLKRDSADQDALGLEAVWSAIGHDLIPNLSSAISRYEGIAGVLFIEHFFYLLNSRKKPEQETPGYAVFYRIMEQLLEFYWYQHYSKKLPENDKIWCYGIRLVNDPDFVLKVDTEKTVAVGLNRYYRGTCYNTRLLFRDQKEAFVRILVKFLDEKSMESSLLRIIDALQSSPENAMAAKDLMISFEEHIEGLNAFFSSGELKSLLFDSLLPELSEHGCKVREVASKLYEMGPQNGALWKNIILDLCKFYETPVSVTSKAFLNILFAEPFLCVIDVCFEFLLCRNGTPLANLQSEFDVFLNHEQAKDAARSFSISCRCPQKGNQLRHDMVAELAETFVKSPSLFLASLLKHHNEIATYRGHEPLVFEDGASISVLYPRTDEQTNWREWLEQRLANWTRDYYCFTASRLYNQLSQVASA